jgi:hypothetical protein
LRVQRSNDVGRVEVTADGRGLTGRAGVAALVELSDRIGLTGALSRAARRSCKAGLVHDPGVVLRDLAVMLADGGDDFSAIETLRGQGGLLGVVASDSTAWRRVADLAGDELAVARLDAARKQVRAVVWAAGGAPAAVTDPASGPLCVDIDATLVTAHSDKESATGTYKGGFGFHPLLAYLDRGDGTGEALAGVLRPGNAGANSAADHQDVFEAALDQLGDLPAATRVLVRADSAGATRAFLGYLREVAVAFSVSARLTGPIRTAIRVLHANPDVWVAAVGQDGTVRDGASVAEATAAVDLGEFPPGTRLLIRREPLHPGAQQTLDDLDGHRFTAVLTDQPDLDVAVLDQRHRAHARVEQRIRDARDTGLGCLPSADYQINSIWLQLALIAQDLLAFFALDGPLAVAAPKTIRHRLLHVAARIIRHARRVRLSIDATWPWTDALITAFARIRALPLLT